jgi:hypothetical protein
LRTAIKEGDNEGLVALIVEDKSRLQIDIPFGGAYGPDGEFKATD